MQICKKGLIFGKAFLQKFFNVIRQLFAREFHQGVKLTVFGTATKRSITQRLRHKT
jgi:hypothetical protein